MYNEIVFPALVHHRIDVHTRLFRQTTLPNEADNLWARTGKVCLQNIVASLVFTQSPGRLCKLPVNDATQSDQKRTDEKTNATTHRNWIETPAL